MLLLPPLVLVAILSTSGPPAELVAAEQKQLAGVWLVVGGSWPADVQKRTRITIADGVLTIVQGEERSQLVVDLDPTTSPRHINLTKNQRVARGIYELKDDTLKLCYEVQGDAARPAAFAVTAGSEILLILRRDRTPD
ncbi:MAG TPA: TIGR03067 domain-containing protein [Gemmatales bacterium]|nr:TIGR03067 domain-containing protein [Gemmatales bacterium]HMP59390.1 TIGR03067 domain-containing protein [Gemmatales bacterium]